MESLQYDLVPIVLCSITLSTFVQDYRPSIKYAIKISMLCFHFSLPLPHNTKRKTFPPQ